MDETVELGAAWSAEMPWNPLRSLRRLVRERRAVAALMALDDVTLQDIGIPRGEIPWAVRRIQARREADG